MLDTRNAVYVTQFCMGKTYNELVEIMKKNCNKVKIRETSYDEALGKSISNGVKYDIMKIGDMDVEIFEISFEGFSKTHWNGLYVCYREGKLSEAATAMYS